MKIGISTLAVVAAVTVATPAIAASSNWHHAEGASLRIVTNDRPDADGRVRGALEIRLKPGWKTYWLDPGDAGVPPTLDVEDGGNVEMAFPAPKRFDDGYAVWAGYDHPVALGLTLDGQAVLESGTMHAEAFLGLCETICIPVQASFKVRITPDAANTRDEAIVAHAFASLPGPARPGFRARLATADAHALAIEIDMPDGATLIDLFVAGNGGLSLGAPERVGGEGVTVPVLRGNDQLSATLAYTLVTSVGSVSGLLEMGH